MTTNPLHESVLRLATEVGLHVHDLEDGVQLRDHETTFELRSTADGWVLTRRDRGDEPVVDLRSNTAEAPQMRLLGILGGDWRSQQGLDRIAVLRRARPVPGTEVVEESPGSWTVRWDAGRGVATEMASVPAELLARLVGRSAEEVEASYRDREGRPLFAPAP